MRTPVVLLALSVGIVLADSSVVTIALPEILAQYDVEIATLAWVLTSFNLALAVSALPAAFVARRRPAHGLRRRRRRLRGRVARCARSRPRSSGSSRAARVQGVAGAAVVCAALDLLSQPTGVGRLGRPHLDARRDCWAPRSGRRWAGS